MISNLTAVCFLLLTGIQIETVQPAGTSDEVAPIEVRPGHVASYPRVIMGRISDVEGQPVAGALVEWGPDRALDAARESTVSADDGTYRLELNHAGGFYKLGISAAGFCPTSRRGLIPGPRSAPTELNLPLQPETTIEVTIVGESGVPIPCLKVTPMTPQFGFNSSFSMVQQTESLPGHDEPIRCSQKGVCQLHQLFPPPPALQVRADGDTDAQAEFKERQNAEGWLSLRIQLEGNEIHRHQITRTEYFQSDGKFRIVIPDHSNPLIRKTHNGTIYAQVVDANGKPVSQYHVAVRYRAEPFLVNDPEGRFAWGHTRNPDDDYELRIFAKGYAPFLERIVPKDTSRAAPRRIKLQPAPSAEFQLLDQQTQKPLANIPVVAGVSKESGWNYVEWNSLSSYADGHHGLETVLHVVSDADGRMTIPEGREPVTFIILTAGYGRRVITPALRPDPDENGLIRILLDPAATIHATRAANSRIAQQGDRIYLEMQSTDGFRHMYHSPKLDENGECLIDSLAPGKYFVGLMHSAGFSSTACWLKTIELKAGQKVELPLGEMTGDLTVSGRTTPFTDVSLRPKPNLPAVEANQAGIMVIATVSDIDGYFELSGLHPGIYDVEQGRLNGTGRTMRAFLEPKLKGPAELFLATDTFIDFILGTVEPPEPSVKSPEPGK